MKHTKNQSDLPGIPAPVKRKHPVTILLTLEQSNQIQEIRTQQYHSLVPFAVLTASLLNEALLQRQKTNNPPQ